MDPGDTWQIIILVALLGFSAFFSASETALMSLSKIRLRHMVDENVKNADKVNGLLEKPSRLLASILVGNNLVNTAASSILTALVAKYVAGGTGILVATIGMTIMILIFGEITPKNIAANNSEGVSLKLAGPLRLVIAILAPIATAIMFIINGVLRLFGVKADNAQPFITQDELKTMVTVSHEEGVLEGGEKKMIDAVFEFGDAQAKDAMTPRTDMIAIEDDYTFEQVLEAFREDQFSRMPVYRETPDDIIGVLYVKDLLLAGVSEENFNLEELMREPYYTYEFKRIGDLFEDMRNKQIPIAIVLDEYGGTAGIITMEDLVEEIVGDIADEYDIQETEIEVVKEDEYIVDGGARIDLVNEMIGTRIESEDFDSIGGFILGELGGLPEVGEVLEVDGVTFKVEEVDKNRIEELRILT